MTRRIGHDPRCRREEVDHGEGLATRSSRGHRTICLPIAEGAYLQAVHDPAAFRAPRTSKVPCPNARSAPAGRRRTTIPTVIQKLAIFPTSIPLERGSQGLLRWPVNLPDRSLLRDAGARPRLPSPHNCESRYGVTEPA